MTSYSARSLLPGRRALREPGKAAGAVNLSGMERPDRAGVYLWLDDAGTRSLAYFSHWPEPEREFYGTFYYLGQLCSDFVIFRDPDTKFGTSWEKCSVKLRDQR
jgi:hypothetical protein